MFLQAISNTPIPVTVVRDDWDWAVVWATTGGLAAAFIAISVAVYTFRKTSKELVLERRKVFELGVLTKVLELGSVVTPDSADVVKGLLRILPAEDLPRLREMVARSSVIEGPTVFLHLSEFNDAVACRLIEQPRRFSPFWWK
jgi:hypothetical protein